MDVRDYCNKIEDTGEVKMSTVDDIRKIFTHISLIQSDLEDARNADGPEWEADGN